MPYVNNLPRRNRPRGLGDVAEKASNGFGTWVVDNFWGLSPQFITGQPQPYGQTVVQTYLPRTNQPRLMNLHMGPVVPGGTQPLMRRMNNNPVFRTPVDRPGAVQTSLPPGAGPGPASEVAIDGFGWIPMGIATHPTSLLERPGLQGFSGYGVAPAAGSVTVTAGGQTIVINAEDAEGLKANAGAMRNIFMQMAQTYFSRVHQLEDFSNVLLALGATVPNLTDRIRLAELKVFGDPAYPQDVQRAAARRAAVVAEVQRLSQARTDLLREVGDDVSGWPTDVATAYLAFINRQAPNVTVSSLGGVGAAAAALASGFGIAGWVLAGLVVGAVAIAGYKGYQWLVQDGEKAARINAANASADAMRANIATQQIHNEAKRAYIHAMQYAPNEQQRLAASNSLKELILAYEQTQAQQKKDPAPGGAGTIAFYGAALVIGLLGVRAYFGKRWLGPRRAKDRREKERRRPERERERRPRRGARETLARLGMGGD